MIASQRITVAAIAGEAGQAIIELFGAWQADQKKGRHKTVEHAIDVFAERVRTHGSLPPVLYFCEWFDHWLMGDSLHGSEIVSGSQFEASCGSRIEAASWAKLCGDQFPEERRLAARLREAAEAWQHLAEPAAVVMLRKVVAPSATDEEVVASLRILPEWLVLG